MDLHLRKPLMFPTDVSLFLMMYFIVFNDLMIFHVSFHGRD